MSKNDGYRSPFSRIVAEHLFSDGELAGPCIEAIKRWLIDVQVLEGKALLPAIADEIEAIITDKIDGQLVGQGIAAELLRSALAEVEWRAIAIQLVKDTLDELTGG